MLFRDYMCLVSARVSQFFMLCGRLYNSVIVFFRASVRDQCRRLSVMSAEIYWEERITSSRENTGSVIGNSKHVYS